jgi:integrase/recombinase XerC
MLRQMTNDELFKLYDSDLVLRLRNAKNLSDTRKILARFKAYLGEYPPSPELAKSFLALFVDRKPRTLYRYAQMVKMFMKWYGEPLSDFKVRIPKSLPPYTEDSEIEKLFEAVENKKTHRKLIVRDSLLIELALKSGMRRGELANLGVGDIHEDFLMVRDGKNNKDRVIPLSPPIALRLRNFIVSKKPNESVFGLKPSTITMKIKAFAKKAGLDNIHAHTLRHKFATDLLEHGANIRSVQHLLGHENLSTTQVYLSITDKGIREAVDLLEDSKNSKATDILVKPTGIRTIITIKGIYKHGKVGSSKGSEPTYFSHFIISNEGKEPAIELEVALLDGDKENVLQGRRETVLMIGEKLTWRPSLDRPDGMYYLVCQYRTTSPNSGSGLTNQTLLPFKLMQADKLGEVYMNPKELEFKQNIEQSDRITIF